MPDKSTVLRWLQKDEHASFRDHYAHARTLQAEHWADEIVEIADDGSGDVREVEKNGRLIELVDHDHINRSRLRVDTRKWLMARMAPKKYGDRVGLEHSGPEGGPLVVRWETDDDAA